MSTEIYNSNISKESYQTYIFNYKSNISKNFDLDKKKEELSKTSKSTIQNNKESPIIEKSNYIKTFLLADKNREKLFKTAQ